MTNRLRKEDWALSDLGRIAVDALLLSGIQDEDLAHEIAFLTYGESIYKLPETDVDGKPNLG